VSGLDFYSFDFVSVTQCYPGAMTEHSLASLCWEGGAGRAGL